MIMLQELHDVLVKVGQMVGLTILAWGCLIIAASIFSGRVDGFIKGGALFLLGALLAGYGAAVH